MKSFLITFLLGVIAGGAGVWYYLENRQNPAAPAESPVASARDSAATAAARAKQALDSKLEVLGLKTRDVEDELARSGKVVRRKAGEMGEAVKDVAVDARITATIKARLLKEPQLSAWDISVSTTDGRVTLAGSVSSHDLIGRAILLAYETDGVREVVSTLQTKAKHG